MLRTEQFRSCTDYREILRIFQKASEQRENFLWQSHEMGKNVIPVYHVEIDFLSRGLVIYYDSQRFKIDKELPLYVRLDYRTAICKTTNFSLEQNCVHFAFPQELKLEELRSTPRTAFTPAQEKLVSLKSSVTGPMRETGSELLVRVMDISSHGLGLIVSEQNRSFLKNNRILWITKMQDDSLYHPMLAEVVYITNEVDTKFANRKQKDLKVGLRLSEPFNDLIFTRFVH